MWSIALACPGFAQQARSWLPHATELGPSLTDNNPQTYKILCQGLHDPCDVGLEWTERHRVSELTVDYATLDGRSYEPQLSGQTLQSWDGTAWRDLAADLEIDYGGQGRFAQVEGFGAARWRYTFAPVKTTRLRVLLTQPRNPEEWQRLYAVREIRAGASTSQAPAGRVRVIGNLPARPDWLEPGANLAVPQAGARVQHGTMTEVRWPRKLLLNAVRMSPVFPVEWWDGDRWHPVELRRTLARGEVHFAPVATSAVRVLGHADHLAVMLDSDAGIYAEEVQKARFDLLDQRFLTFPRKTLSAMRGLLLPLDFAQTAIGRPGDVEETHVTWNGTFLMVENPESGSWNHGEPGAHRNSAERWDRWFAFAAGERKELFGSDWTITETHLVDDEYPATITRMEQAGLRYEEKLYVTAPGSAVYGTVAEVTVTNSASGTKQAQLTLTMGRRRNHRNPGPVRSPLSFEPQKTGYRFESGGVVRRADGEIVVAAEPGGVWEGTELENHLRYSFDLAPGQSKTLHFLAPSVTAPLTEPSRQFDWEGNWARFTQYWDGLFDRGMELEVPEEAFNRIYKSLLAQALIITRDGPAVKYGSYSYEDYFGIEEGWPAIALAQYGFANEAERILSIMLSPELMDKTNYHHQYRNGLEPWYAITAFRLSGDRAWLQKIAPELEAAADWTIRAIHENKDPAFAGLLPKHAYGGDIHLPAYSFYSNATCWRGLHDTALAFRILGQLDKAARYEGEAKQYRERLLQLADKLAERDEGLVFLPMRSKLVPAKTTARKNRRTNSSPKMSLRISPGHTLEISGICSRRCYRNSSCLTYPIRGRAGFRITWRHGGASWRGWLALRSVSTKSTAKAIMRAFLSTVSGAGSSPRSTESSRTVCRKT